MNVIASTSNIKVKRLVKLRDRSKEREKAGLFLVEGERLVLDTPAEFLEEIYVTEETRRRLSDRLDQKLEEAEKLAGVRRPGCPAGRPSGVIPDVIGLSKEVMEKVSDTKTPQGILAVARQPEWRLQDLLAGVNGQNEESSADGKKPLLLILEDIQDPGNLGTMFRTAEAAGATGIIMSRNTVDLFNPKTVRATMSSIFRVPFIVTDNLPELIHVLQGRISGACAGRAEDAVSDYSGTDQDGVSSKMSDTALTGNRPASSDHSPITVYAAMPARVSVTYDKPDYRKSTAFLIGNEGNGLRQETAAAADQNITIPMAGSIESLNAAMSAGILLYEAARQRR